MASFWSLRFVFIVFCVIWIGNQSFLSFLRRNIANYRGNLLFLSNPRRDRLPTTSESSWNVKAVGRVQTCYLQKHVIPRQATISQQKMDLVFCDKHKKTLSPEELAKLNVNMTEHDIPSLDQIDESKISQLLHYEAYNLTYVQELHQTFSSPASSSESLTVTDITRMIDDNHPLLSIGKIILFDKFWECIHDLEGFDYLWVLTYMHLNAGYKTKIRPRVNPQLQRQIQIKDRVPDLVGLFSSRAPHRPNPIALSALSILHVDHSDGVIYVQGSDLLNDTPILDIKPYIPAFDSFPEARAGWMDIISPNRTEARVHGYQQIYSARGARATRAGIRKKLLLSTTNTSVEH